MLQWQIPKQLWTRCFKYINSSCNFSTPLWNRSYKHPHFTDETKAQRVSAIFSKLTNEVMCRIWIYIWLQMLCLNCSEGWAILGAGGAGSCFLSSSLYGSLEEEGASKVAPWSPEDMPWTRVDFWFQHSKCRVSAPGGPVPWSLGIPPSDLTDMSAWLWKP